MYWHQPVLTNESSCTIRRVWMCLSSGE